MRLLSENWLQPALGAAEAYGVDLSNLLVTSIAVEPVDTALFGLPQFAAISSLGGGTAQRPDEDYRTEPTAEELARGFKMVDPSWLPHDPTGILPTDPIAPAPGSATLPNDPRFTNQWHLNNTSLGLLDLNVLDVWDDYTGAGIDIFVFDDGFDYNHADLAGNYDTTRDYNYGNNNANPFGLSGDAHGTAVAGIIGAVANNSVGVAGVAYDANLIGYRDYDSAAFTYQSFMDDLDQAFNDAVADGADVINISQGLSNTPVYAFGIGLTDISRFNLESAIDNAVDTGRAGLGTIIVKSAGNARSTGYDANESAWAWNTQEVNVAAVDQNGFVSSYSTFSAANLVSGFGTPGQVETTDRSGSAGYNSTDYTSSFNGTSSAAPMVSGVVALMLEANPGLGWRDVQDILSASARHVGTAVGSGTGGSEQFAWFWTDGNDWNGGGRHFSADYGYGLVDAEAAVRMAETWFAGGTLAQRSSNESSASESFFFAGGGETIDGTVNGGNTSIFGGTETYSVTETTSLIIERVEVNVQFETTWIDDLDVSLIAPDGTVVELAADAANGGADFNSTWTFGAQAFRGDNAQGTWQLVITDDFSGLDETIFYSANIVFYGKGGTAQYDDRYIFTNELSDYAGGPGGHATTLGDTDGGEDTVNAAAVDSAMTIRLWAGGTSVIDGVSLTTVGNTIENAVGGVLNDLIEGNSLGNVLDGTAGDDTLNGRGGEDTLNGGDGNDTFLFEDVDPLVILDNVNGGAGTDRVLVNAATDGSVFDFSNDTTDFTSIEEIEFSADGANIDKTVIISAEEFSASEISNTALIDGNDNTGSTDILRILIDQGLTAFDGSGLTFIDFGSLNAIAGQGDYVHIVGSADADTVTGTTQADSVEGDAGNDTLNGGDGNDTLAGGDGNDSLLGGLGGDSLVGGGGTDTLLGGDGNDTLDGQNFTGDLFGEAGDDLFVNTGGFFIDNVNGGTGSDTLDASAKTVGALDLDLGGNTYTASSQTASITSVERVIGTNFNDTLNAGGVGGTTLEGGAGADSLIGGLNAQTLIGGAGDDIIDGGFAVLSSVADSLDGGDGNDTITGANGSDQILGGTGDDIISSNFGNDTVFGGDGADILSGGGGNDVLFGEAGTDSLGGDLGDDILDGGDGNDDLNGGDGNDSLLGGLGNDIIRDTDGFFATTGVDTLDGGEGNDTVFTDLINGDSYFGGNGTDWLDLSQSSVSAATLFLGVGTFMISTTTFGGFENVLDSDFGNTIFGDTGQNIIIANGGDDSVDASSGDDSVEGGLGNDSLQGNFGADTLIGGDGNDSIHGDIFGAPNDETDANLLDGGAGNDTLEGSGGDDTLLGGTGNDSLTGNEGNDSLEGGGSFGAPDTLDGGAGNDTLVSAGDGEFFGGDGDDLFIAASTSAIEEADGGAGTDTIDLTVGNFLYDFDMTTGQTNYTGSSGELYVNFENVILADQNDTVEGNAADNIITGGGGNDSLDGNAGFDTIDGEDGDDFILGGGGFDLLLGSAGLDTLLGETADDTLDGGDGSDLINGGNNNDSVLGAAGDDKLFGGNGEDTIFGEADNDTLVGGKAIEKDFLFGGVGNDILLGQEGEDTLYGGADNDRLSGGSQSDFLVGEAGDDTLLGGGGNDTMVGGTGDDEFTGAGQADLFVFEDGFGTDTITDFIASVGAEKINLAGVSAITDVADLFANHLTEVAGNAVIFDGLGNTITLIGVSQASLITADFDFTAAPPLPEFAEPETPWRDSPDEEFAALTAAAEQASDLPTPIELAESPQGLESEAQIAALDQDDGFLV